MKKRLVWVTVALLITLPFSARLIAKEFDHRIDLEQVVFEWRVAGNDLEIMISGKTEGWVAVGFNPTRMMKDANVIIGYVEKGKVKIADEFGTSLTGHKEDKRLGGKNHVKKASGVENEGVTTLRFTIPLNSGDAKDGVIEVGRMTRMIFAIGAKDNFRSIHRFRTAIDVNLETGQYR